MYGKTKHQWYNHKLNHYCCMRQLHEVSTCNSVITVIIIMFVVIFTHFDGLSLVAIICCQGLVITGYYYYHWLSDNQRWPCTKMEDPSGLLLRWTIGWDVWLLYDNAYIHFVFEVWGYCAYHADCMGPPITITIAGSCLTV